MSDVLGNLPRQVQTISEAQVITCHDKVVTSVPRPHYRPNFGCKLRRTHCILNNAALTTHILYYEVYIQGRTVHIFSMDPDEVVSRRQSGMCH